MFIGAVPHGCVEQLLRVVPFDRWPSVYVACSGSFKLEQAILGKYPDLEVHGNDVSLYTCSLGQYLINDPIEITFHSRLQFIEDYLGKSAPYPKRVAAVLVPHDLSRYAGDNLYGKKHFEWFKNSFPDHLIQFHSRLDSLLEKARIKGFFRGDWRKQVERAAEVGAGVVSFPPTYKGGYERMYKFLDSNISWDSPSFDCFDPKDLPATIDWIKSLGIPYCIGSDQHFEEHKPCLLFATMRERPFYAYSNCSERDSLRHWLPTPEPFLYTPIDTKKITRKSKVEIVKADVRHINFIKDAYLAKGISHAFKGNSASYFVLIDKMLAGGIIYKPSSYSVITDSGIHYEPSQLLRILSDVCLSTKNKCSKLISMIATSRSLVLPIQNQKLNKIEYLTTTAFSNSKMSMKYRGIFELNSRRPSTDEIDGYDYVLQYGAKVTELEPHQIYRVWFDKYSGLKPKARNNRQQLSSRKA